MNLYETVKTSVSVPEAAERYGMDVGQSDMARCIFHDDRHPSMKLYDDHVHCFGCGAHGDVIGLTAALLGLSNYEAARRLAYDFGLSADRPPQNKPRSKMDELRQRRSQLRQWKDELAPRSPDDEPDGRYIEACKKLDYVEYLLEEERYGKKAKVG